MQKAKWIWYNGNWEFYHLKAVNFRRTEHGVTLPPFWQMPSCQSNVRFTKRVNLAKAQTFTVHAHGVGYVEVDDWFGRYKLGATVNIAKGEHTITVCVATLGDFPCIFVEGEDVFSDESWQVDAYDNKTISVGCSEFYTLATDDPTVFPFSKKLLVPVSQKQVGDGVLYDYGKEVFAEVYSTTDGEITLYFGESEYEAVDVNNSYLTATFSDKQCGGQTFGFRYVYIPRYSGADVPIIAYYQYLPQAVPSNTVFNSDNALLNDIWRIAGYTFELNSREFYLDGIKRDRWVWSGDAYQCYFTNRYYAFDEGTARRTIVALGGNGTIRRHINTINDYTFYWVISVYDHYVATGDEQFVREIFPRVSEFMDYCINRLDENNLVIKRSGDWIFIDWAELDKEGATCAEQILFIAALKSYCDLRRLVDLDTASYDTLRQRITATVLEKFWDEQKGAFIDSFTSGKRKVTRHSNIFALLFDIVDNVKRESIIKNVLLNDKVAPITTPYFKFFELEALCAIGKFDEVLDDILSYWGSMVSAGATSFWEEFDADKPWKDQLDMYGIKFCKSLCHAWGASPIYLLGRYFLGVYPTAAGYDKFTVQPHLDKFNEITATVPICGGSVNIVKRGDTISVTASKAGGLLIVGDSTVELIENVTATISL